MALLRDVDLFKEVVTVGRALMSHIYLSHTQLGQSSAAFWWRCTTLSLSPSPYPCFPHDNNGLNLWTDNPPYDKGAFRIEINFPAEYPFKPPKITFKTKIYHPNIDEKGQVCLPVISAENWKPATKTDQVIQSLIALVNDPQPEHPLRADLAEEYSKDRKKFCKNAEEFTKKYGEKRPVD